jgi:hypothetical protein
VNRRGFFSRLLGAGAAVGATVVAKKLQELPVAIAEPIATVPALPQVIEDYTSIAGVTEFDWTQYGHTFTAASRGVEPFDVRWLSSSTVLMSYDSVSTAVFVPRSSVTYWST